MSFDFKKCSFIYMLLFVDVLWIIVNEVSLFIIALNATVENYIGNVVVISLTAWEAVHDPIYSLLASMILPNSFHVSVSLVQILLVYVLVLVYIFILLSILCKIFLLLRKSGSEHNKL